MVKGHRFALTTDLLTDLTNDAFLAVTLHYITLGWEMASLILECVPSEGRHTSENIAKTAKNILEKNGLGGNDVEAVVTDNGFKIVARLRDNSSMTRHPCMAHTLDLCANNLQVQ